MHDPYSPPRSSLEEVASERDKQPARVVSRCLMGAELVLIAVPSMFLLLVFGLVGLGSELFRRPDLFNIALTVASVIAFAGLASGGVLGLSFVIGGTRVLAARGRWWWALGAGGGVVALLGLAARLFNTEGYSVWQTFLESFCLFSLGLPLLLPFAHLAFELRRGAKSANH